MHILAATDLSTRSYRALRRAGRLASERGAQLTIVHVVDDDQPAGLVELEMREVDTILREQTRVMEELRPLNCRSEVVAGDPFDGILRTATSLDADLIVMGVHRKQFIRDIFVGTTLQRVIRSGSLPVLTVNDDVSGPYETAIAAVDTTEPSAHALRTAQSLRLLGNTQLTLVHAFLPLAKGKMLFSGLQKSEVDNYVESERREALCRLKCFLEESGIDQRKFLFHVEEGLPREVISKLVETFKPSLIIMGTHSRTGIAKAFLGSVTEEVIRSIGVDILVVPPPG